MRAKIHPGGESRLISYELKTKLEELKDKFQTLTEVFNEEEIESDISKLEKEMSDPNFWNRSDSSQVMRRAQALKRELESFRRLKALFEDVEVGIELAEEDPEMAEHVEELAKEIEEKVTEFELYLLLSGPYDDRNAFLSVHPGAGGTESHDWAEMLLRMYVRWAEKKGFQVETVEYQEGEEAGVKSATIRIVGEYAYGYLKFERGVHRLVRISPFDANHRRHTSFASVNVVPEIEEDIDIEIRPEDLRIDTFRASGHGGQHVNRTDSAVRITHIPTGIVVTCQNERSQHQNKATALKILKARLYEIEMEKKRQELLKIQGELKDIAWGSQIRSYVFHPYTMVKDHRTGYETGNIDAVMDGELDDFIKAELVYFAKLGVK
ncbi:MAG: peptide chain release factor 2 [Thermotogota bacterium]|nr:peptide chain release factor 2 [Thermotogota bacterium]MDK2864716.1 peptide chain release factor 2 [Thermotogota bacterium]